jgi:hypothetical protein
VAKAKNYLLYLNHGLKVVAIFKPKLVAQHSLPAGKPEDGGF